MRARAESLFDREKRREAEIADALKQEQLRHDDVIRNMQRLRDLRLSRDRSGSKTISIGHEFHQNLPTNPFSTSLEPTAGMT